MNFEMWFFHSASDWFNSWGLVYPGVWIFFFFWIFAFSACIGSFLNVCIWRIPRGESLSKAASHCTVCGAKIRWYDNIPVASYLILRGRCRSCRTPYSSSYFFVELICALLVTALWAKTGLCRQLPEIIPARMLLIFFGMACAVTDMRFRVVPDKLTYTGMIFALVTAALLPAAWGVDLSWEAALQSLAQGLFPAVFLAIFAELGKLIFPSGSYRPGRCEVYGSLRYAHRLAGGDICVVCRFIGRFALGGGGGAQIECQTAVCAVYHVWSVDLDIF